MARWWQGKGKATYSVIGCVTDDGSTFCPAVIVHGDVRSQLADKRPYAGSVVYVVRGATSTEQAAERALTDYEQRASAEVWERGEVHFI